MFYLLKLYHFGQMGIEQKKRAATENLNFCEKPMAVKLFLFVNYSECKLWAKSAPISMEKCKMILSKRAQNNWKKKQILNILNTKC